MFWEDDCQKEDPATVGNPSHSLGLPLGIKEARDSMGGVDSISTLPDDIIHHIFSFIPTKFAIRTSLLSKRWRRVWSDTPSLSFDWKVSSNAINKILTSYSATKIMTFHLYACLANEAYYINSWMEFAMSHNVENLSLDFFYPIAYNLSDCFFSNSSLKQLIIDSDIYMTPRCNVSWTSLRNLSLRLCKLSNESFPKILSGCPMLESLTLQYCWSLQYLDLSKSMRLRRLDIKSRYEVEALMQIVAPHINYLRLRNNLRLRNSESQCTLFDFSSLTEANVDISYFFPRTWCNVADPLGADFQVLVQTMLVTLQNVEKFTVGVKFLQVLTLSKLHGVSFPMLKVKTLTLETTIVRSVVPGIARLLQNSPELKKITIYTMNCSVFEDTCVERYLFLQDLNPDQCWRLKDDAFPIPWKCKVAEPKLVASFMELLLANTRTLETLVVRLGSDFDRSGFEELCQIAQTISHNNKVSIVLK